MDPAKKNFLEQARPEILDERLKKCWGVRSHQPLHGLGASGGGISAEQSKGANRWFTSELVKDSQGVFQVKDVRGR